MMNKKNPQTCRGNNSEGVKMYCEVDENYIK